MLFVLLSACGGDEIEEQLSNPEKAPELNRAGEQDGNRYFTDENGDKLFNDRVFYNSSQFKNGYCTVTEMKDSVELVGIIDSSGKEIYPISCEGTIGDYDNGFFRMSKKIEGSFQKNQFATNELGGYFDFGVGFINTKGEVVIEPKYHDAREISDGTVQVSIEKGYDEFWGIVNMKGEEVVACKYYHVGYWHDDLCLVKTRNYSFVEKYGFIDRNGNEVIPTSYQLALNFEQGISLVMKNNKIGFINKDNETVIDFNYTDYMEISDQYESDFGSGPKYNSRFIMEEGYIIVQQKTGWGYIDTKGKEVIPCIYDDIKLPVGKRVAVTKDGKSGHFELTSTEVSWD